MGKTTGVVEMIRLAVAAAGIALLAWVVYDITFLVGGG